jgi:hypothetical protein
MLVAPLDCTSGSIAVRPTIIAAMMRTIGRVDARAAPGRAPSALGAVAI